MNVLLPQTEMDQHTIAVAIAALLHGDTTPEIRAAADAASRRLDPQSVGFELPPRWNGLWAESHPTPRQTFWPYIGILIAIAIAIAVASMHTARMPSARPDGAAPHSLERRPMGSFLQHGTT